MSSAPATAQSRPPAATAAAPGRAAADSSLHRDGAGSKPVLFDLDGIDLAARLISRQRLESWNAHRGQMALLDWVVWHTPDYTRGIGLKHVRDDEFWVPGHFPGRPMLPGVLMIETGAQLASYLYNARFPKPKIAAFTRIEDASFRAAVGPGDDLYLLAREVRVSPKRFISDIQGYVDNRVVFEARITGMAV